MAKSQRKKSKKSPSKRYNQDTLSCTLPLDIMMKILSYLDDVDDLENCLHVSKSWNSAALQPSLWKKFVCKEFGGHFNNHDSNCNWFEVYKHFHGFHIRDNRVPP